MSKALLLLVVQSFVAIGGGSSGICTIGCYGDSTPPSSSSLSGMQTKNTRSCDDLDELFIKDNVLHDNVVCQSLQSSLGTLCGCLPVDENACLLCPNEAEMPEPTRVLPIELVSSLHGASHAVTPKGFAWTCALFESYLNNFHKKDEACQQTQTITEIQYYCGCNNDIPKGEERVCTVCAASDGVEDEVEDDVMLLFTPDKQIEVQGGRSSLLSVTIHDCASLQTEASLMTLNSDECNAVQNVGTLCGCPIPENACRLCPEGSTLGYPTRHLDDPATIYSSSSLLLLTEYSNRNNKIDSDAHADAYSIRCDTLEAVLHSIDKNSNQCSDTNQLSAWRDACGGCVRQDEGTSLSFSSSSTSTPTPPTMTTDEATPQPTKSPTPQPTKSPTTSPTPASTTVTSSAATMLLNLSSTVVVVAASLSNLIDLM